GVAEIAHAFLVSEATIEKRITRAKGELRHHGAFVDAAAPGTLSARLESVHSALYVLFSEGYHGSHPEHAVREDLCAEAMRLCAMLCEHPAGDVPTTHALMALFFLHASRLDARVDEHGSLQLLAVQDRSKWNRELIE